MRPVPVGVQPEYDGLLICLLCQRGFKGLAHHIKAAHGLSAEEYKDRFELPKRGLLAETTMQKRRDHARHLLATDERVRNGLLLQRDRRVELQRLKDARAAASKASRKAGVREILRHNGRHAAEVSAQMRRDAHQRRAQELGYTGIAEMMARTVHLSNPELGKLLGCSASAASKIRRTHRQPTQHMRVKKEKTQRERRENKRRDFALALEQFADGIQPRDGRGRWRCQSCGHAAIDLASHLSRRHQMTPTGYLGRLAIRQRLERQARSLDYPDLANLLTQTASLSRDDVAAMLGISRRHLANVYDYFPGLPTRSAQQVALSRSRAATRAQQGKRQRARDSYDRAARKCGFEDIEALVAATGDWTYQRLGAALDIPAHRVQFVRRRYG